MVWDDDVSPAMFLPVREVTAKHPDVKSTPLQRRCVGIKLTAPAKENFAQTSSRKSAIC